MGLKPCSNRSAIVRLRVHFTTDDVDFPLTMYQSTKPVQVAHNKIIWAITYSMFCCFLII